MNVMTLTVHATCCCIGEDGVLLRGPSGSGKSTLARRLVALAGREGPAALVCDDRVRLHREGDDVVAEALPEIAGLIEMRGIGLVRVPYVSRAVLRLVVDLGEGPRLPDPAESSASLLDLPLARLVLPPGDADAQLILIKLRLLRGQEVRL